MSAVALGSSGLPVQLSPVLPQTPPVALILPPVPQPPTAIAKLERQAGGGEAGLGGDARRSNAAAPSGRGKVLDIKA
jgi:hypothetical protein